MDFHSGCRITLDQFVSCMYYKQMSFTGERLSLDTLNHSHTESPKTISKQVKFNLSGQIQLITQLFGRCQSIPGTEFAHLCR